MYSVHILVNKQKQFNVKKMKKHQSANTIQNSRMLFVLMPNATYEIYINSKFTEFNETTFQLHNIWNLVFIPNLIAYYQRVSKRLITNRYKALVTCF